MLTFAFSCLSASNSLTRFGSAAGAGAGAAGAGEWIPFGAPPAPALATGPTGVALPALTLAGGWAACTPLTGALGTGNTPGWTDGPLVRAGGTALPARSGGGGGALASTW